MTPLASAQIKIPAGATVERRTQLKSGVGAPCLNPTRPPPEWTRQERYIASPIAKIANLTAGAVRHGGA